MRAIIATLGAWFIYGLIWIFGRTHKRADIKWLEGPLGDAVIGDAPFKSVAEREGLSVERMAHSGGLIPSFEQLRGGDFDPAKVQPIVRDFYENTTDFAFDVWSRTYFPANIALALLVTTISRQVNQLNFPLSPLDTATGMTSEIILMREKDGRVKYTGWFRTLAKQELVLYTGFYMTAKVPNETVPCVKVVFPMPNGNATVILRPRVDETGALTLDSGGGKFGGVGFYRVQGRSKDRVRVWKIRTLREHFRVFVDEAGVARCDHAVSFLGMPVLRLHYKMVRKPVQAAA
jgi:hypothetical protein